MANSAILGIAQKGAAVLSAITLIAGTIDLLTGVDDQPVNVWFLIGLGFLAVTLLLWGVGERAKARAVSPTAGTHHHGPYFAAPVNLHIGGEARQDRPAGEPTPPTSRVIEGDPDNYRVVNVWDLLEPVPGLPPSIINRTFRYVELRGPALIGLVDFVEFRHVTFEIAGNDIESIIWPMKVGRPKVGPIAMQACVLENCQTASIGFTGSPQVLEQLRDISLPKAT